MSIASFFRLYRLSGTAHRQEYWAVAFAPIILSLLLIVVFIGLHGASYVLNVPWTEIREGTFPFDSLKDSLLFGALLISIGVWGVLMLSSLWWNVAVFVRRSRSMNVSAHWSWLYVACSLTSALVIPFFIWLGMFLVWGIVRPARDRN